MLIGDLTRANGNQPGGSAKHVPLLAGTALVGGISLLVVGTLILSISVLDQLGRTSLNQHLVVVLAVCFIAPFLLGEYMILFTPAKRIHGLTLLLIPLGVYFIGSYAATKGVLLGRYYSVDPSNGSITVSDHPVPDGSKWMEITQSNICEVTRWAAGKPGRVYNPAGHDWFDKQTGCPLLYYSGEANQLRFFNGPGLDPLTRQRLTAVTPEFHAKWERSRPATPTLTGPERISGSGWIMAPGYGRHNYRVFKLDARANDRGGILHIVLHVGPSGCDASFDLYAEGAHLPSRGAPGSLAGAYDIRKGGTAQIVWRFERGQVFVLGAEGNWFSPAGSSNTFSYEAWADPPPVTE
jgi:hypothetical protein